MASVNPLNAAEPSDPAQPSDPAEPRNEREPGGRRWYRRGSTWAVLVAVTSALSWWVGGW